MKLVYYKHGKLSKTAWYPACFSRKTPGTKSRDRPTYWADIWVSMIYRYRPKLLILSASVGVDKTLLYSSHIQTTCTRKHNEPSQDSYLSATLAGAFHKQADKLNHEERVGHHSRNKSIIINQIN